MPGRRAASVDPSSASPARASAETVVGWIPSCRRRSIQWLRAMRKAWADAGLDPATVGYVECHATGTPLGDRTELTALRELLAGRTGDPVVVADYLTGHGVSGGSISAVNGYGESRPIDTNETREGRARNRRTELVVQK